MPSTDAGTLTGRNTNVDAIRFVAALGVISLHVGLYPDLSNLAGDIIRASFRWCVPFFMMVTGYYLANEENFYPRISVGRIVRPLTVFAIGSAVFAPLAIAEFSKDALTPAALILGTYYHLWYLTAIVVAFVVLQIMKAIKIPAATFCLSAGILVAYVAMNYVFVVLQKGGPQTDFLREFIGVPCLTAGAYIRRSPHLGKTSFAAILVASLILMTVEFSVLSGLGFRPGNAQFLFSTLPLSAAILGLAVTSRQRLPIRLAELGRNESLAIYVYHPLFVIGIASLIAGEYRFYATNSPGLPIWIMVAFLTPAASLALRRYAPKVRGFLDGDVTTA